MTTAGDAIAADLPAADAPAVLAGTHGWSGTTPEVRYTRDAGRWLFLADLLVVGASVLLFDALRRLAHVVPDMTPHRVHVHQALLAIYCAVLVLRLGVRGQYEQGRRFSRIDDTLAVLSAAFLAASVAVLLETFTKGLGTGTTDFSRLMMTTSFLTPTALLVGSRLVGHAQQTDAFRRGSHLAHCLVLGDGGRASEFCSWMQGNASLGILPTRSTVDADLPIEQFEQAVADELRRLEPQEVVLAYERPLWEQQQAVVRQAVFRGITVKSLPGVFDNYQSSVFEYRGVPITTVFTTPSTRFARRLKVLADPVLALVLIVLLAPLFLTVAACIWASDRGPVFFRQPRIGYRGRTFSFWKFRSMRVDADAALRAHLEGDPVAQAHWSRFQKLHDDPRVTRVGRFIRRTSIDELPQLFNVLVGDMSLVGPRPPLPDQVEGYGETFVFSQARPGITGLWQVSGRNDLGFEERVGLDVFYVENWSFWLDVQILLKTVVVVFQGDGAQ